MARSTAKAGKSETLTIRLDPKMRFVLDYLSRLKGQTITTVVERAITSAASGEAIRIPNTGNYETWQALWDISDGVRALTVARCPELFPSYEEERRLKFCEEHWPFFFIDETKTVYSRVMIDILWRRIDLFIDTHDKAKFGGNYWAAGRAMQEALEEAEVTPPDWPVKEARQTDTSGASVDEDLPF